MRLGTGHEVNVPMDAAKAEHVLVFQIRAVAPLVHLNGQGVISPFHIRGDVEFGIVVGTLAVTHLLAIDPHVKGRIDAVKMQEDFLAVPFLRQGEIPAVRAHGIGFLFHGIAFLGLDERRVAQERIRYIGIERGAVTLHLPVGGNLYLVPLTHVVGRLVEGHGTLLGRLDPVELPGTVEQEVAAGGRTFPRVLIGGIGHHLFLCCVWDERGMARFLIDGKHLFVFPVVGGGRLGNDELDLQGRFPDAPTLKRAACIGLELPHGFPETGLFPEAQHQPGGYARERISPVFMAGKLPCLVGV